MSKKLLITTLLSVSSIITTGNSIQAQTFDDVFVFSDSLSDIGNAFNAFVDSGQTPVPPNPPYFNGRFTNGLVWTENLSLSLGITPNPNNNYAFGGSQTGISNLYEPVRFGVDSVIEVPGLLGQVNNYLTSGNIPEDNDLFLIWIGANDYSVGDLSTPESVANLITQIVTNINTAVIGLNNSGANNIAVANLPNLGKTPRAISLNDPIVSGALTNLTIAHNQALDSSLNNLESALGNNLNLEIIDMFALLEDITNNPTEYDLTNVTQGCLLTPTCNDSNSDQFFFWDDIHPTAEAHRIIGDFALQSIPNNSASTPEPNLISGLAFLGLIGLGLKLKSSFFRATGKIST